jgi:hypothetical protein
MRVIETEFFLLEKQKARIRGSLHLPVSVGSLVVVGTKVFDQQSHKRCYFVRYIDITAQESYLL